MRYSNHTPVLVSGASLLIYGMLKGGKIGVLTMGAGGALVYWGVKRVLASEAVPGPESAAVSRRVTIRKTVTVDAEPYEAYAYWRDLTLLPSFIGNIRSAEQRESGDWRLSMPGPLGIPVYWDIKITNDQPGHVLEWRSTEDSKVQGAGLIRFKRKQNGRGTKIHTEFSYLRGGRLARAAAEKVFGSEGGEKIANDLQQFRQAVESR